MRYLVYLQAQDLAVAVDDMEKSRNQFEPRPYFLANPQLRDKPLFGEFRGHDNPELIVALDPAPQVIFKTYGKMGHDPVELQKKTGIPVIALDHGQLGIGKRQMEETLLLMGRIIGREQRAKDVIAFFNTAIEDLRKRTADIPEEKRPTCYIGGIAYRGPHGITSTEPAYPPFIFVNAANIAADPSRTSSEQLQQTTFSKESLVAMDPEKIFVDLSTIQGSKDVSGLEQLQNDPAFRILTAVRKGEIYGVLPYNWYSQNHGSILADAYFIGKVLYPDRFEDIDPAKKADEIYAFLVGKPVFDQMNKAFGNLAFEKIDLSKAE
ncbi:MAG TPA: iron ABC transporter substrate-binding protein [Synergistales bacterium]|nr:iron ABC transporter substrate-binding protein [Synergistales bacterium]